jgi:hypothetical protein
LAVQFDIIDPLCSVFLALPRDLTAAYGQAPVRAF